MQFSPAPFLFRPWCAVECAICHHPIQAALATAVPTKDGQLVHRACADREAMVAWGQRQRRARRDGYLLLWTSAALWLVQGTTPGLLAIGALSGLLHLYRHRRWWRHVLQPLWLARYRWRPGR